MFLCIFVLKVAITVPPILFLIKVLFRLWARLTEEEENEGAFSLLLIQFLNSLLALVLIFDKIFIYHLIHILLRKHSQNPIC